MDLFVNAHRQIYLDLPAGVEGAGSPGHDLMEAFEVSEACGLLALGRQHALRRSSASFGFWYGFVSLFMRSVCTYAEAKGLRVPMDHAAVDRLMNLLPVQRGSEYVSSDFLSDVWDQLCEEMIRQFRSFDPGGQSSLRDFLKAEYPAWQDVGLIHFHLAETRREDKPPFVFLATYSVKIPGNVRVQHRQLGGLLEQSMKEYSQDYAEQWLRPIQTAARESAFIADLLHSKRVFRACSLRVDEAYEFVKAIPVLEQCGIVCRVPDFWRRGRPPEAKVAVTLGGAQQRSQVGFDALVDFDIQVAIDGQPLTKDELRELMEAEGPLIEIGGRWVEADPRRIKEMLAVWHSAKDVTDGQGLQFSEAMRLLCGFDRTKLGASSRKQDADEDGPVEFFAGPALKTLVEELQQPSTRGSKGLDAMLETYLRAELRPYQKAGLVWLRLVSRLGLGGCLADDMGLGKTIQIIALLLCFKHEFGVKKPSLLVLPASLLGNWTKELDRFAPSLVYVVVHGSQKSEGYAESVDLVITTYGMMLRTEWMMKRDWYAVIADEAQAIKNAETSQSRLIRSLKASVRMAMTGTPVENNLGDLWAIFDFCCPGLLGGRHRFKNALKSMKERDQDIYGPLRQLIAPYLLRRKKTDKSVISDLPEKIEMSSYCLLTRRQAVLYQKEVDRLKKALEAQNERADGREHGEHGEHGAHVSSNEARREKMERKGMVLTSLMKLKQICNHPSQYLGNDSYEKSLSGKFLKLEELAETIASRNEKLLVFTQFREVTDILSHFLSECFGRDGLVIHGGTPVKDRQKLVDRFQDPAGPPFFVLSLKAGGTGLNLTQANHVVHFDRWWNPAVENQATDRAFRIGQKKNVLVHKFIAKGTIEDRIDAMICAKQQLADAVVDMPSETRLTELSDEELLKLVQLDIDAIG